MSLSVKTILRPAWRASGFALALAAAGLAAPAMSQNPIKIRFAHSLSSTEPAHLAAEFFVKNVAQRTNNRVQIQVFPSEQLGSGNTRDVSLTVRVLRSINSAAYGLGQEITSLRHALVLLGIQQVRNWAAVWAMAGVNSGKVMWKNCCRGLEPSTVADS